MFQVVRQGTRLGRRLALYIPKGVRAL